MKNMLLNLVYIFITYWYRTYSVKLKAKILKDSNQAALVTKQWPSLPIHCLENISFICTFAPICWLLYACESEWVFSILEISHPFSHSHRLLTTVYMWSWTGIQCPGNISFVSAFAPICWLVYACQSEWAFNILEISHSFSLSYQLFTTVHIYVKLNGNSVSWKYLICFRFRNDLLTCVRLRIWMSIRILKISHSLSI